MQIKKCLALLLMGTFVASSAEQATIAPEGSSGFTVKPLVYGRQDMVVTNNPWASKTASYILKQGGNAVDAAIAAAFVLGLTEPSSSGLGGGGFALTYNHKTKQIKAYDGREIAPHTANPNWFMQDKQHAMPFQSAVLSYKSVGVPGEVALLKAMHQQQGHLPWRTLLQPAIQLAKNGFPMSPRLHQLLTMDRDLLMQDSHIKAVYFSDAGEVKPLNAIVRNIAYAKSLAIIAKNPDDFYTGKIAKDIVAKINQVAEKPIYSLSDFTRYAVLESDAICSTYRANTLCSTPFASGGVTLIELMKIYASRQQNKDIKHADWPYYFLEASKLAYADRNQYLADVAFVQPPLKGLIADDYIHQRSQFISNQPLKTPVAAGVPVGANRQYIPDGLEKERGTTALAIVDKHGNAVSMSLTIEHQFGSHLFVDGFFLNNQLTDFSFTSKDKSNQVVANRVEAFKRPRSAMAPVMVFNPQQQLIAISGSPGGSQIICYVAKSLIQMIDFNKNPAQAAASANLCAVNDTPVIESRRDSERLIDVLANKKVAVNRGELLSGIVNIERTKRGGWLGAADPRREGEAIGK